MSAHEIHVFAPATVANVACGFDIFGFALHTPGDELIVKLTPSGKVRITCITGDGGILPLDPSKNTAGVSALKFLEHIQSHQGVDIEIHKKMPLGSGLGSSAASAAGSVFALNQLLGTPFTPSQLIPFAMEGERIACGSAHADNVAPALLGGFVLVRSYAPLDVISIDCSLDLHCAILHPHIEIRTAIARQILPANIPLQQHVTQSGNAAGLVVGMMRGDARLVGKCLQDIIAEPLRSPLIPGFDAIKAAALEHQALGCSISGSGPSIFALATTSHRAANIGDAMHKACSDQGFPCQLYLSTINTQGPKVLS
jgi:homoserine kinase